MKRKEKIWKMLTIFIKNHDYSIDHVFRLNDLSKQTNKLDLDINFVLLSEKNEVSVDYYKKNLKNDNFDLQEFSKSEGYLKVIKNYLGKNFDIENFILIDATDFLDIELLKSWEKFDMENKHMHVSYFVNETNYQNSNYDFVIGNNFKNTPLINYDAVEHIYKRSDFLECFKFIENTEKISLYYQIYLYSENKESFLDYNLDLNSRNYFSVNFREKIFLDKKQNANSIRDIIDIFDLVYQHNLKGKLLFQWSELRKALFTLSNSDLNKFFIKIKIIRKFSKIYVLKKTNIFWKISAFIRF